MEFEEGEVAGNSQTKRRVSARVSASSDARDAERRVAAEACAADALRNGCDERGTMRGSSGFHAFVTLTSARVHYDGVGVGVGCEFCHLPFGSRGEESEN